MTISDLRWRVSEDAPYTNSDVVPNLCQAKLVDSDEKRVNKLYDKIHFYST